MTQGYSGSFAVNGVNFLLPPTTGRWIPRDTLGLDGNNRPIYPALREFELHFDLMAVSDLQQLINSQLATVTGTTVVDLPKWGANDYLFYSYSGTMFQEPETGVYFAGYVSDVTLIIRNIRTN